MNWNEIKENVEKRDNVMTVTMDILRDAHGAGKLGVYVRQDIAKKLAGMGLGHVPQSLPNYQHDQVRLYKRGTPVGDLIELVLSPSEPNDTKLVEQFREDKVDYAAIVTQIREMVSDE